ncbi:TetR/AcrR family transcriptional regulator [Candidatus Enterococcus mansonii]|uniref:HTH tetR-type domain-containing protein n=1 Tax=Candidatus Enterococcus mansonii TaxID=1834181 RepID=A0A242CCJ6_9ENTE|nr:TetR/AcrR family transcriptional regulator [Enterococcus sp. 4G2_DIV0659]OTO07973.1 hypothetical protein A5880_002243 [Enterococcus sp. 4G2_DIV0659]
MRDVKEPQVRRAEIMEASLLLFLEKGYMDTTTQDIINKVGISRGLLYYHFKNKDDILYCLIELYSEPLLKKLSVIAYANDVSAIEKIKNFLTVTFISPDTITKEKIELQKAVDLEQNRYLMDKFSHKFIDSVTKYFAYIIEQGVSEKSFNVAHPNETSYLLMTGYVFTANSMNSSYLNEQNGDNYLSAFKELLTRTLGAKQGIFN